MKIVIAMDSFKGSMTSLEAGEAAAEGVRRVFPDAQIPVRPLADGGEGTAEALTRGMGGILRTVRVTGPLGEPVNATYGILEDGKTAVMEMAAAAGLTLVPPEKRNPMNTTTYGVGEMIRDAIEQGCRSFVIGIGGSATNDGGIGMLQALGYGILDEDGYPVARGAKGLAGIRRIRTDRVFPALGDCRFRVACDVTSPLCGEEGASVVFGPQKGAAPEMVREMDAGLAHFAGKTRELFPDSDPDVPGSGAAGGLGYAFRSYLGAELESGVKIVLEETHLEAYLADADLVITGEGRLDAQTAVGKGPAGVAALAKQYGKPVLAFAGSASEDARILNEHGIDAFFPILRGVVSLEGAMDGANARRNMADTVEQVMRLVRLGGL